MGGKARRNSEGARCYSGNEREERKSREEEKKTNMNEVHNNSGVVKGIKSH